jgi:hypothetical protein
MLKKIQRFTGNYEFLRKASLLTKYWEKKYKPAMVILATTYSNSATCLPLWPATFALIHQTAGL